jgi:hypothetical protein
MNTDGLINRNRSETNVSQTEIISLVRDSMYYYQQNMRDYNDNIRDYNDNMRRYTNIIRSIHDEVVDTVPPPLINSRRNAQPPIIETPVLRHPATAESLITTLLYTVLPTTTQDALVRPTAQQIVNATDVVIYDDTLENSNTACPIVLEDFQNGDSLLRIRQCGHTFSQPAIQNWFNRNVRCPVCRLDIRTDLSNTHLNDVSGTPMPRRINRNNILQNLFTTGLEGLTDYITNTELNTLDASNSSFVFDIQLPFNYDPYYSSRD